PVRYIRNETRRDRKGTHPHDLETPPGPACAGCARLPLRAAARALPQGRAGRRLRAAALLALPRRQAGRHSRPGLASRARGGQRGLSRARRMSGRGDSWTGRVGFILATIGSAVGIGSVWKFPYEVGANGGSAFLLFYLLGLLAIVLPLMLAEFAIGRRGGGDSSVSIATVAARAGAGRHWALVGVFGVLTGFLILSFYSVIGG